MRSTSGRVYSQRVEPGAVVARALGAEVEAAGELAHDQQVDPLRAGRPEVRVDAELLAQSEQTLFGPNGLPFELGQPDGREQHRVRLAAGGERLVRQRRSLREDRVAAERMLGVLDAERVEHPDRLGRHLGPDPVTGEDGDVSAQRDPVRRARTP